MKLWRIIEYPFLYTKAKKICKIPKPSGLSLNPLFKKECHLQIRINGKEFSFCHKLEASDHNIFAT